MKQVIGWTLCIVLLLGISITVFAQQDGRENDHVKLRALKDRIADAFNRKDAQAIASCFTKEFAVTTVDQTTLTSAAAIDSYLKKTFQSPDSVVTDLKVAPEADILTRFIDADNGYCYGRNHEIYTLKDGRKVPMESRWTATMHRENGEWKVVAIHAGVNLMDNPVIKGSMAREKMATGVAAALGVLFVITCGALFLRLIKRKGNVA